MEGNEKFVYFDLYCKSCKNETLKESEDPCDECLTTPARMNTHEPINWEEK